MILIYTRINLLSGSVVAAMNYCDNCGPRDRCRESGFMVGGKDSNRENTTTLGADKLGRLSMCMPVGGE